MQWQWARGGGLTGRKSIVNDPEYAKLLDVTQTELNAVITGELEPKEALDEIAKRHERILKAGRR